MANWCTNFIEFTGKEENIINLSKFVKEAIERQTITQEGQMINHMNTFIDGYFFNIHSLYVESNWLSFQYESKWTPNIGDIKLLGQQFELNFKIGYEEMGNCYYGKQKYEWETDQLYIKELVDTDFEEASYFVNNDTDETKLILDDNDDPEGYYTDYDIEKLDELLSEYEWTEY